MQESRRTRERARRDGSAKRLAEGPAGAKDGTAQVVVAGRGVAQLDQQQVNPGGELHRRRQLENLVLDSRVEAAAVDVNRDLCDRPAVEVPASDFRNS